MRTDLSKLRDVSLVTEQDEKQCVQAVFVKGTVRNLTMLDIIGLAVLTVFQQELFRVQRTEDDNPQERVDKSED